MERMEAVAGVVERARKGDPDAFRELVEAHSEALFRLAYRLTGSERTGAEDLIAAAGLADAARARIVTHRDNELDAPISSGSYRLTGTIVLPASAGTVGALAAGTARTLIHRAGAVAIKEGWPLVLGFRETPLSLLHLENLRRLAYAGAIVIPPIPAFYIGGEDMGRFLDHYALRVLDRLGVAESGAAGLRWQ